MIFVTHMSFVFFYCHLKQILKSSNTFFPILIILFSSLFIILAPSVDLISWAVRYDEKRIIQVTLLLLPACWILISRQGAEFFLDLLLSLHRLSRWSLALVSFLGLLSSFQAPATRYAILELSLFMLLAVFSLTVATLMRRQRRVVIGTLLAAISASAFAYQVTFFTSYVGIFVQGNPLLLPEPFSGFSNIRFFNQFQIWTLPLIVLPLLLYPRLMTSIRWLVVILAVGWWVLLFASQSRGAQLAIALALTLTLLVFRKDAWRPVKATLLTATAGWLLYLFLFFYVPDLESSSRLARLAEDPARLQLWQQALRMATENPWLGVGPMHYAYYPNTIATHPHNGLLQIAAEWGLPATAILVILAGRGSLAWPRRYFKDADTLDKTGEQPLWIALFCSLMAGMTYAFVSGLIVMPLSQTLFAVIVGLMLGLYHGASPTSVASAHQILLLRLVAGAAMAGLLWTLLPDTLQRIETDNLAPAKNVVAFGPRFWQEGGIPHPEQ